MKMQYVIIYPNIYECVSEYMKIYHDRFWTFYGHVANEARQLKINKTKWKQFPRNRQIVQNIIWMIPISFRQKRLPCRSVSDSERLLNCLFRKQSEKYSAKWDRGFRFHGTIEYRGLLLIWCARKNIIISRLSDYPVTIFYWWLIWNKSHSQCDI